MEVDVFHRFSGMRFASLAILICHVIDPDDGAVDVVVVVVAVVVVVGAGGRFYRSRLNNFVTAAPVLNPEQIRARRMLKCLL